MVFQNSNEKKLYFHNFFWIIDFTFIRNIFNPTLKERTTTHVRNEVFMQGIVASGIVVVIIAWCIKKRGPLFVSVFCPLQLVLVDIAAYLMLDEKLYLGRYSLKLGVIL